LVTLTGFGGIGKSRLALRVAAESQRAFPQGVAYIPLAGISDPELVAPTFIGALGLEGRSTRAAAPALVDYLKGRSMLLVVDNAEHLVDAVALLVDALLRTCPDLRILVTSREPLRIRGEIVHSVQPLTLPVRGTTEPLQQFEAAALFLDRARAVHADFEVDASNRDAIAAIVERLEGIPLAMELAAGRLTAMSAVELAESISERWEFVSRGSRAAPDRQQTMTACIEWSFALCTPAEAELWARLSVFGNGFELDAVRGTCAGDDAEGRPVEDLLLDLVDKSIVIATTTTAGRSRYRMLPPIRSRGIAYLRSHDLLDDARRRHRDWYVGLAVRASEDWMGAGQLAAMQRLRRELGNLQVALEFCTSDPSEVQAGLEIGAHLLEWGLADGLFRDSRMWFNRLLSLDPTPTPTRALALRTAAWFAAMQGDLVGAAELLEEGRSLAERYDDEVRVPLIQATGFVAMFSGELDAAATHFETALEGFRALGDTGQQAHTLSLAQLNDVFRGRLDSAIAAHEEVLRLTEPVGELWYRSYSMWIAGLASYVAGDHETGSRLQRDSLRLKRNTQDRLGIGTSIEALAYDLASSDPMLAAHLMGAAQGIWDRIQTSTEALAGLHLLHQQCDRLLHERLSDDEYDAAFGAGRTLTPIEAIDLALDDSTSSRPAVRARGRGRAAQGGQPGTLTRRELQIAELVAEGLANRDIASLLVISKRTAETHVEHILTKLGFTNRNQVAAWFRERDLTS
jgi:non-specific serine/threonine protein kinase